MQLNFYHVTLAENLRGDRGIQERGLLANPPHRNWAGPMAPLSRRVYLFSIPKSIPEWWAALLAVTDIDPENLVADEDSIDPNWGFSYNYVVKDEQPRRGEKRKCYLHRIVGEMGLCGALASIFIKGTAAHLGDIPVKQIVECPIECTTPCQIQDQFLAAMCNIRENIRLDVATAKHMKPFHQEYAIDISDEIWEDVLNILTRSSTPIRDLRRLEGQRKKSAC